MPFLAYYRLFSFSEFSAVNPMLLGINTTAIWRLNLKTPPLCQSQWKPPDILSTQWTFRFLGLSVALKAHLSPI